jgi:deoxycytidylate deaminase
MTTELDLLLRDKKFYDDACDLAYYSDYSIRVACIAAKGAKRICGAVNTVRNSALNVPFGEASRHAEYNCLTQLASSDKVTLYIARLSKTHQEMPSRPCNRCMLVLRGAGIKEIVYMDRFHKVVKEKLC